MNNTLLHIFEKLKKEVEKTFLQAHTTHSGDIKEWKGQEIVDFQEDLFQKTKGTLSEKWFYSYFKKETDKLPRIDMLNILSQYVGEENWASFIEKNNKQESTKKDTSWTLFAAIGLAVFIPTLAYFLTTSANTYNFCFVDNNTNQLIESPIEVIVLRANESPFYGTTNDKGCFTWETNQQTITAVIKSPYHQTDTIFRAKPTKGVERIKLKTDDYALMIHYYSSSNVKDWRKRRAHLKNAIHTKAIIYQVLDKGIGVELFTKNDFINKLTLPTSGLKNIDILQTKYKEGKIVSLKFKKRSDEH